MTAALIIAAGKTDHKDRFSPEKQFGRISALMRMVLLFQILGIQKIVVVGDEKELSQKLVPSMNLVFFHISEKEEMLDGIKMGLNYLQDKCKQAFISPVDVPLFSKETMEKLTQAEGEVCIPSYQGRCGHPILLQSSCFSKILSYHGSGGLKGAIQEAGLLPSLVETQDPGILASQASDVPCEALLADYDIMKLRASFRLRISREKVFYGPGAHHLLQLIEEFGSLSSACQHMGMSYTKGRKIIATMEEQLGTPVLQTKQGGKDGGYSRLTAEAQTMMRCYSAFLEEADILLQELFQKHFSDFI